MVPGRERKTALSMARVLTARSQVAYIVFNRAFGALYHEQGLGTEHPIPTSLSLVP